MSPRRCLPLLAFALAGLMAGPATAAVPDSFYTPSAADLTGKHGQIAKSVSISGGSLPTGGRSHLIMYRSKAPDGTTVAVTGIVTVPKGKAPKGGFPVISWAHGTTGIADSCAPSRVATNPPSDSYVKNFRAQASHWVKEGVAVAQTDYQGLGTPGMHPYLIGVSEGRSVIDIVSAARNLDRRIGRRWAAVGHSQGGHAVLWAAALGPKYAKGLQLVGAVPVAPASHIGEQADLLNKIEGNPFGGLPALIIAAGLQSAGIAPETALSPRALELYPQIEQVCLPALSQQDSFGGLPLSEHFKEGYDTAPAVAVISQNDPEELTIRVPLLITQGEADNTVLPLFSDQLASKLRSRGAKVAYRKYKDATHTTILNDARKAIDVFLERRFG